MIYSILFQGDCSVLHCATQLRTIFASLGRADGRMCVPNVRCFHEAKLDRSLELVSSPLYHGPTAR